MKNSKCRHIIVLLCAFFVTDSYAQESFLFKHSHYLFNPYLANPAIAGSKDFNSISISLRQYISAVEGSPKTQIISGHGRLRYPAKGYSYSFRNPGFTNIGVGGLLYNNSYGAFRRLGAQLTYAYHVPLNREAYSHLSFGLSATGLYYSMNPNLFNVIGDPLLSNGTQGSFIPDANFGIYYYGIGHYAGLSVSNLFESGLSLGKDEYETIDIHRRYFFIAGYQWLLFRNRSIMLEPSVMIQTTEETVADFYKNIDINLKLYTQSIYFGTSLRVNQSMAFFTLYQFRNIFGGLSYEIPFSKAINITTGSAEIIVGMNFGKGRNIFGDSRYW